MFIGVKDGRAVSVRGNPDHPVNRGMLCPKGLSEHHTIDADNRARVPAAEAGTDASRASTWDDALDDDGDEVPRRAGALRAATRSASSAPASSSPRSSTRWASWCSSASARRNYDGNTTLCMSTAVAGYKRSFGSDGPPGAYEDLETRRRHPADRRQHRRQPSDPLPAAAKPIPATTLIVVDPRVTKTAMMADLHLPIRPRSDLALLNGLDPHRHRARPGRSRLHRRATRPASTRCASRCATTRPSASPRSPASTPELIYRDGVRSTPAPSAAFIAWTMGVNHSTKGTETVNAINNLALITGNIGRAGAAPFSITGQCNAMGTREAGFASSMPGLPQVRERRRIAPSWRRIWNVPVERIPDARGLAYPDIIEAALDKRIRALWIIATNPDRLVSQPRRAAAGARRARVPRRAGRLPPDADDRVRAPRAAGRDLGREGRDLHQLGAARQQGQPRRARRRARRAPTSTSSSIWPPRSACATSCFPGWRTPRDAFEEWKRVSAGRLCDYSGMTYEAIEQHGGIQWPFPGGRRRTRRRRGGSMPTASSRPTTAGRG